jgi:MFS family permease
MQPARGCGTEGTNGKGKEKGKGKGRAMTSSHDAVTGALGLLAVPEEPEPAAAVVHDAGHQENFAMAVQDAAPGLALGQGEAQVPLWPLFVAEATLLLGSGLAGTAINVHALEAGERAGFLGAMGSLFYVGLFAAYLIGPAFLARLKYDGVAVAGLSLMIIGTAFTFIREPMIWLPGRVVAGFGLGLTYILIEAWIGAARTGHDKAQAIAFYAGTFLTASMVSQLLLLEISPASDLPLYLALAAMAVGLVMLALAPKPPLGAPMESGSMSGAWRILTLSFVPVMVTMGSGLIFGAFNAMAPVYGLAIGLSMDSVVRFGVTAMLGAAIMPPLQARLGTRLGTFPTLVLIYCISIASAVWLAHEVPWSWLATAVAFLWGAVSLNTYALGAGAVHVAAHGRTPVEVARVILIANGLGGIAGPIIGAWLVQLQGPGGLFVYTGLVCAVMLGLSVYAAVQYRATQGL